MGRVELRQRRDGIGNRGSLIRDMSKKGSGIAGAFLEADQVDLGLGLWVGLLIPKKMSK